jgi:hypothetical protein
MGDQAPLPDEYVDQDEETYLPAGARIAVDPSWSVAFRGETEFGELVVALV